MNTQSHCPWTPSSKWWRTWELGSACSPSKPQHLSFRNLTSENGLLIIYFLAVSRIILGRDLVVMYKKVSTDDECRTLVIWLESLLPSFNWQFFLSFTTSYPKNDLSLWICVVLSSLWFKSIKMSLNENTVFITFVSSVVSCSWINLLEKVQKKNASLKKF